MTCLVEISTFSPLGKSQGAASFPGAAGRRRSRLGSFHCMGREKGQYAPHLWPVLANTVILLSPGNERAVYPSFLCIPVFIRRLLIALQKHHAHLCSQSRGGNRRWISECFQWWCDAADFSKEPSFIPGHVNAGPDFFMSPGSSAHSMFCVSRVRLDAKWIWLFY